MCELKTLFELSRIRSLKGEKEMMKTWRRLEKSSFKIIENVSPDAFSVSSKFIPLIQSLKYMCCGNYHEDTPNMNFEDLEIVINLYSPEIISCSVKVEEVAKDLAQWIEFEKSNHHKVVKDLQNLLTLTIATA